MSLLKSAVVEKDHEHLTKDPPVERNAIQLLLEVAAVAHEDVKYAWESVGSSVRPVFICKITMGGEVYIGKGNSKKAAKHNAAKVAYDARECYAASPDPRKRSLFTPDGDNPIWALNKLASEKKLPLPDYVVIEERRVGPRTTFIMGCHVGNLVESGSGYCKKTAKQEAALKMLEKLNQEDRLQEPASQDPLAGVLPIKGPIRPLMGLRQDHIAQEMHPAAGYNARPLNTDTIKPLMGTGHSAQPIRPLMEVRQDRSALEVLPPPGYNRPHKSTHATISPLIKTSLNAQPIPPLMEFRRDRSAKKMQPSPGFNTQKQSTFLPLNTATIRPLMGNGQSAQKLGGNARYPETLASLNSDTIRVLLLNQHGLGAQELNTVQGSDEEYIWARVSKSTGKAMVFLEEKGDLGPEEMETWPEKNTGSRGHFVTLKPAGPLERPLEQLRGSNALDCNSTPGTNSGSTLASTNLITPRPLMDDFRPSHALSSMSTPDIFKTGLEHRQVPSAKELYSAPEKVIPQRWSFSFSNMQIPF